MLTLVAAVAIGQTTANHVLWQIGDRDGSDAEFALAPDKYRQYRDDPVFVVGASQPSVWPYVLPGPDDAWAGSRQHLCRVVFGLKSKPKNGQCRLTAQFLETHYASPPRLALYVNRRQVAAWQAPAGNSDDALFGHPERGRSATFTATVAAESLREGVNTVDLQNESGSWAVFDSVAFEGPPELNLGSVPNQLFVDSGSEEQAVLRTPRGPRQVVEVRVTNIGKPGRLVVSGRGVDQQSIPVGSGSQSIRLLVRRVSQPRTLSVTLSLNGDSMKQRLEIKPVRAWTVYLMPHSHLDIGYTDYQPVVEAMHRRNLFDALYLDKETATFPHDARVRFNAEGTWILDNLEQKNTKAEFDHVVKAIRTGTIDCSASYCNTLTALMRPEELVRSYEFAQHLKNAYGISLTTATQTDIPGMTWGAVSAMAEAGVKQLILMPNPSDRIGGVLRAWQDKPFYWISPSGDKKVFVWETASYGVGHGLRGFNGDRTKMFRTKDPTKGFIDSYIFPRLRQLSTDGYPYSVLALPWSGTDNFPVDADVPYAVRAWNERYVVPRVETKTFTEACEDFQARYAAKIPRYSGDLSPYWEDGAGSSALETAMNRASVDRLVQAEALSAMNGATVGASALFHRAWSNAILYSEHTWGAWNSISQPDADNVKEQWEFKSGFALQADEASRSLLINSEPPSSRDVGVFTVTNTCSWTRTDLVTLTSSQSRQGDRVVNTAGEPQPSQRLDCGDLAVLVQNIPAFSSVTFRVAKGSASCGSRASATPGSMESSVWDIQIDRPTGTIKRLLNRQLNRDFASAHGPWYLNQYLYLLGTDLNNIQTATNCRVQVLEKGPLVSEIQITSDAPGTRGLTSDIRIVSGLDRVDIANTLDKTDVRAKEGVHFAFPFQIPNGQVRIHTPWAVIRPDKDQLAGSNKNWFNTQYYVDISNQTYGVTWSSLDAPLMEVGAVSANLLGGVGNPSDWRQKVGPTQTLYSWALNNHWHTNYRASQSGLLTFRYSLFAHGAWDPSESYRFGVGLAQPLIVTEGEGSIEEPLLTLKDPSVVVSSLKPSADGKAVIVRLWGASGQSRPVRLQWREGAVRSVSLTDLSERPLKPCSSPLIVPGWGILTLRAERA